MKLADIETRGNVIRLFWCSDELQKWYGDDWDDCPYEYNAGQVYDEFVSGITDIAIPFDYVVSEPKEGHLNSPYSKNDMLAKYVPIIVVTPCDCFSRWKFENSFEKCVSNADSITLYMHDDKEEVIEKFEKINCFLISDKKEEAVAQENI